MWNSEKHTCWDGGNEMIHVSVDTMILIDVMLPVWEVGEIEEYLMIRIWDAFKNRFFKCNIFAKFMSYFLVAFLWLRKRFSNLKLIDGVGSLRQSVVFDRIALLRCNKLLKSHFFTIVAMHFIWLYWTLNHFYSSTVNIPK